MGKISEPAKKAEQLETKLRLAAQNSGIKFQSAIEVFSGDGDYAKTSRRDLTKRDYKIRQREDQKVTDLGPFYLIYYEDPHQPNGEVIIGSVLEGKTGRFTGKYVAHAGGDPPTCFMKDCLTMEEAIAWLVDGSGDKYPTLFLDEGPIV